MQEEWLKLTVRRVYGLAFEGVRARAGIISAFVLLFVILPTFLAGIAWTVLFPAQGETPWWADMILGVIAAPSQIAMAWILYRHWSAEPISFSSAIKVAISRFLPICLVGLIALVAIVLGLALLVVPGLMLVAMWWVMGPVTILEPWKGPRQVFQRSMDLTKGSRWTILLILLLCVLTGALIGAVIGFAILSKPLDLILMTPLASATSAVVTMSLNTAAYFELVRLKGGHGSATVAVFD